MPTKFDFDNDVNDIIEDAGHNGRYKPLALLSPDSQKFLIENKFNERQKNDLVVASIENHILDDEVFIDMCRKSKLYDDLMIAFRSSAVVHGYYDIGRIEKIYSGFHNNEFENKRKKNGTDKKESERMGSAAKIIACVALNDFKRSFDNPDIVSDNGRISWKKFISAEFTPKVKSWVEYFYFWGRIFWAAVSGFSIISGLILASLAPAALAGTIVSVASILISTAIYYLNKHFLRDEKEVKDSSERNTKLSKLLQKTKNVYNKVVEKEKANGFIPICRDKDSDYELRIDSDYNKKRLYKALSGHLGIAAVVSIFVLVIACCFLIPPVATFLFVKTLPVSILLTSATTSGIVGIGSFIGHIISKKKYKTLKEKLKLQKDEIQSKKIELSDETKEKILRAKTQEPKDRPKEKDLGEKSDEELIS